MYWQYVQVWGNGCTRYLLTQRWVNLTHERQPTASKDSAHRPQKVVPTDLKIVPTHLKAVPTPQDSAHRPQGSAHRPQSSAHRPQVVPTDLKAVPTDFKAVPTDLKVIDETRFPQEVTIYDKGQKG